MIKKIKATKLEVLRFIQKRDAVEAMDLVNEFGFTFHYARVRLHRLKRANPPMVEELGLRVGAYCLTNEATRKLEYYDHKP